MVRKTANGYEIVGKSNKPITKDNLTENEAKTLHRKIEAYKASRKVTIKSIPKKVGKKNN